MKFINLALCCFFFIIFFFSKPSLQAYPPAPSINPRLFNAYIALQAWKHVITSDPRNFTRNWYGYKVCNYTGVYCAPAPDNPKITTVAGIDLNHANISGYLPEDLGLLTDLAVFHINSNRFVGTIPKSFSKLRVLYELDVSNNLLYGKFPSVVLSLPSLKFLDIRYNQFKGNVPSKLWDRKLDALFINNNDFQFAWPKNFGKSTVSALVMANIKVRGCIPPSIANMSQTLNEIILTNAGLNGCLPEELGLLKNVTVFDVSFNNLVGKLPETIGGMKKLEHLNVAHNKLSGEIPASICSLPRLENFTYSDNYFCVEPKICLKLKDIDDKKNCIPYRPSQRSVNECKTFYSQGPVDCSSFGCSSRSPPPPPPSPPPPPPPPPPPTKSHFYHYP
ncbi:leucine-rich repeat extensin-like protein 6 [Lycium ferocissimum]|uniref:leucine-rich repeat extensin-like protein 6 n=1 Tax=Lycium ferocissimum TaxID=112874 RepID=UPI0028153336|nr:leucine-rich repeat extensin-like protein 6 [Lycium ferocissimum]